MDKLRKIAGYSLLVISCIAWAVLTIIPFLSMDAATKTAWAGGVFIFAEITWWVSIPLLGKEFIEYSARLWRMIKLKAKALFKR